MISILDLFRIGIGPSSSHTVGPMRIARRFLLGLERAGLLPSVARVHVQLQGSLALTGAGHGSPDAAILGLLGCEPETIDPDAAPSLLADARQGTLALLGKHCIAFNAITDLEPACEITPDLHPNGMRMQAFDSGQRLLKEKTYFSTGGGFIASGKQLSMPVVDDMIGQSTKAAFPFASGAQLLSLCEHHGLDIADLVLANEHNHRPEKATLAGLDAVIAAMLDSIDRGLRQNGLLPGDLNVRRRAPAIWSKLVESPHSNETERLFDWLNVFAMAVNEENAAGGRVVTAPTNGAAGIVPAVMRHYCFADGHSFADQKSMEMARRFLLTAGGIGLLYKQRASISGAEMGCQGEVGVACSMAAAGLAAIWGGTPVQIASAAEIGMEHNLGLTCDPVGGLVQIPCIERNAIGTVKAVNAARLALHSHETPKVSLDQVIETMRQTGVDMSTKYKETSQGGLAVNVVAC